MRTNSLPVNLLLIVAMAASLAACETAPVEADMALEAEAFATADVRSPVGGAVAAQLAQVRAATAKYHRVERAEDDGYGLLPPPADECVEVPGLGGMGYHYVNVAEFMDGGALDPTVPEALVYEPHGNGLRLVAVEYLVSFQPPEVEGGDPIAGPRPSLFGVEFDESPHVGPLGAWTLHVWLWRNNPSGMFAPFNPKVSCS